MTTLNSVPPDSIPPESIERELLINILRNDHHDSAMGYDTKNPECPKGGKCECPNAKKGLEARGGVFHCDPDPQILCPVLRKLCPQGTYS